MPAVSRNLSLSRLIAFSFSSPFQLNPFAFCFIFLFFLCSFFSPCFSVDEQGQALLSWKNTLNGSANVLRSWNPSDPHPCNWLGIVCNTNGQVTTINLASVDLQGPFPSNLQPLKYSLNVLILSDANLTGPIPKEIGNYAGLSLLDIGGNGLSGEIPEEICRLTKLETLYVNSNLLEGGIPLHIGNISSLVNLALYDNRLTGEIPKSIGKLRNLRVFRAGGNGNLKGELPAEIGNCSNLVMLGLAETGISGNLPKSIGFLQKLETLAIYTAYLSGPIPEEMGNCTQLRNLYLYQNLISGPIPTHLGQLRKLENLLLWQNSLVGSIPHELGNCENLLNVDLSENMLSGSIPASFGNLRFLQGIQLSVNQISGTIPPEISNCTSLTHIEVDNNELSGGIPVEFDKLKNLNLFFAWRNNLTGSIPESLAECSDLQALDLSYNQLTGSVPKLVFELKNLTKLLLLSNELSGFLPPEIGNCTNLYRLRLNDNRLGGTIPSEIGYLKKLNFIDLGSNMLTGQIPETISGCESLEFLDFHSNGLTGSLPPELPRSLQLVDLSDNRLTGSLTPGLGSLTQLTKLVLRKNRLSGHIPPELGSCTKLQMLELGDNDFSGDIPPELGQILALEISLNLSCNHISGQIPAEFAGLERLGSLDLAHNNLTGYLAALGALQNLVTLNVSYNAFSGELPDTQFFQKLPMSNLAGNPGLLVAAGGTSGPTLRVDPANGEKTSAMKLVMSVLLCASGVILLVALYVLVRARVGPGNGPTDDPWEMTLYQKMELCVEDVLGSLVSENVIGTGSSGVVYRVEVPGGPTLAVKKMWPSDDAAAFWSEIRTLGSIRHRNIIRLVGWCANRTTKLLFYDYLPNGSLSGLLHAGGKCGSGWVQRYDIVLGVAHALAYLHHDCVPPIMHGDVKTMNVLLGTMLEVYLADFGLAKLVIDGIDGSDGTDQASKAGSRSSSPHLAGSYGYMAPEYACMQRVTEKSDVYSYGVVMLEVLTGRHPLDPTLPGGVPLVQWVRDHYQGRRNPTDALNPNLRGGSEAQMQEILQVLAIAILCVNVAPHERPTMKDVVALLKEIRRSDEDERGSGSKGRNSTAIASSHQPRMLTWQGSSNCSFAFSDSSV